MKTPKDYPEKTLANRNATAEALAAFPRWMNRPVARVQVYSVRVARRMFGLDLPYEFFWVCPARKEFPHALTQFMRKEVAAMLRIARKHKAVTLPLYTEEVGEYSQVEIHYPPRDYATGNLHSWIA